MANNPTFYNVAGTAAMNAQTALLFGTSSTMVIYSGTQPAFNGALTGTLLVTLTFSAGTAFLGAGTSTGGTVASTANTITSGVAVATNTAGYFALLEPNGTTIWGTGTCGVSSADLIMSSTSIVSGGTVSCSSFVISQPLT